MTKITTNTVQFTTDDMKVVRVVQAVNECNIHDALSYIIRDYAARKEYHAFAKKVEVKK